MKRSGHAVLCHSGFILSGGSRGGGAEGDLETWPPSYLRVWMNAPQQILLSVKLWYETQSICLEEGRGSFKSLPVYHFRK